MDYVCSYNPDLEKCVNYEPQPVQAEEKAPNVVMIAIESFSPSPMMLNKNVTSSQEKMANGPLFNDFYLPELAKLSEEGISFSGMSS